jgi:phosphate starvation-inducible PhoH-like protein
MAETRQSTTKIVVPASQSMVALLGPGDAHLRTVEKAFPTVEIHARGNEINVTGDPGEVALVERW